jgi:alpha-methylacyl-CoA racemase
MPPLSELIVLDFSTLLPGPLASLILAEAGATIIKVEKPGGGDEMRGYRPRVDENSLNFHLLNRGKKSLALDLKDPTDRQYLDQWIEKADVILEQFRPGTMKRLNLDYETVRKINPAIIYCSLTGWGQTGPKALKASHDLNFMAESGLLGLSCGKDGTPGLPPILAADIAGGSLPAVTNILLALMHRSSTGQGTHLDIAMADSLYMFAYESLGAGLAYGQWAAANSGLTTGGSARYWIYTAADGRHLAVAPLEDKFWNNFCQIISLSNELRDAPPERHEDVADAVQTIIGNKDSSHWMKKFEGQDVCCSLVESMQSAVQSEHNRHRGLGERTIKLGGALVPVLPLPIAPQFRSVEATQPAPALGSLRSDPPAE